MTDTKPKAGDRVVFNAGRGLLAGVLVKGGVRVMLDDDVRVDTAAGLVSDGPGRAFAPEATRGAGVGQWLPKE